jgi:Mce-associated membrane protein
MTNEEDTMAVDEVTPRRVRTRNPARTRVVRLPVRTLPRTPDSGPEQPPQRLARRSVQPWSMWRMWTVALSILLVSALAVLVVTGQPWYEQRRLDSAHRAALTAAVAVATDFVSISSSTVDRDLQRIAAGATGDFKDEFTRGTPQVRSAVVENNVDSHGRVLRAGLVSGDLDSAVVLVAVDATITNARSPQGRLSHYRIQVDMALDSTTGRWLVSRLQFVG